MTGWHVTFGLVLCQIRLTKLKIVIRPLCFLTWDVVHCVLRITKVSPPWKLQMCVPAQSCLIWIFATPWTPPLGSSVYEFFPGRNTGLGCHFLLQRIFPTQGSTDISCVSCIGRQTLYHSVTWEIQLNMSPDQKHYKVTFTASKRYAKSIQKQCITWKVF